MGRGEQSPQSFLELVFCCADVAFLSCNQPISQRNLRKRQLDDRDSLRPLKRPPRLSGIAFVMDDRESIVDPKIAVLRANFDRSPKSRESIVVSSPKFVEATQFG